MPDEKPSSVPCRPRPRPCSPATAPRLPRPLPPRMPPSARSATNCKRRVDAFRQWVEETEYRHRPRRSAREGVAAGTQIRPLQALESPGCVNLHPGLSCWLRACLCNAGAMLRLFVGFLVAGVVIVQRLHRRWRWRWFNRSPPDLRQHGVGLSAGKVDGGLPDGVGVCRPVQRRGRRCGCGARRRAPRRGLLR